MTLKHEFFTNGELRYEHLLNKPWNPPEHDCFTIPQRMYAENCRVVMQDYARPNDWWVDAPELDLYARNFLNEGFELVDIQFKDLRPMDGLLLAIPDPRNMKKIVTNHAAVYIGDGDIVHHRYGQLSQKIKLKPTYKTFTTHIIRHKSIPDLRSKKTTDFNLMDMIPEHKKRPVMGALNDRDRKV